VDDPIREAKLVFTSKAPSLLWWGEMAPPLKRSPDLGNSFPVPRALMYDKS
jgi:hypothetical protein